MFDRLIVSFDDAQNEREPLCRDLCGRCTLMLSAWLSNQASVVMLDRPSLEALKGGVVNSRASVAATKALADLDAATVAVKAKASA